MDEKFLTRRTVHTSEQRVVFLVADELLVRLERADSAGRPLCHYKDHLSEKAVVERIMNELGYVDAEVRKARSTKIDSNLKEYRREHYGHLIDYPVSRPTKTADCMEQALTRFEALLTRLEEALK